MICPRCRRAMVEQKHIVHGHRKWICPKCGRIRFQKPPRRRVPKGKAR